MCNIKGKIPFVYIVILHMNENNNAIRKGATILGFSTFFAKLLGAIYRVPLTNIIGGYGLGLYQMVFPIYCVLLDFSGAGLPSALSKLISSANENREQVAKSYLKTSIRFFSILGLVFSFLMAFLSFFISNLQGDSNASLSYITLAPSVFLVCVISSFRGYFQGEMDMKPTAVSQIIEQVIKLVLGIILTKFLMPNVSLAVAGATFSITISELVALLYLLFIYKRRTKVIKQFITLDKALKKEKYFSGAKRLLKLIVPITLIGIILPISQVVDSFLIINILKKYQSNATSLYGLYSGVILTIVNLPVAICYGISSTLIPAISRCTDENGRRKSINYGLSLTLALAIFSYIVCVVFSSNIIDILFRNLTFEQKMISNKLLKIASASIVFHALLQSVNGILIGKGKTYSILIGMVIGVVVKILLNLLLLNNPSVNIYGASISLIACYFTALLINLILVMKKEKPNASKEHTNWQFSN